MPIIVQETVLYWSATLIEFIDLQYSKATHL